MDRACISSVKKATSKCPTDERIDEPTGIMSAWGYFKRTPFSLLMLGGSYTLALGDVYESQGQQSGSRAGDQRCFYVGDIRVSRRGCLAWLSCCLSSIEPRLPKHILGTVTNSASKNKIVTLDCRVFVYI